MKLMCIIMPVYKSEQYLSRCISFIVSQTYQSIYELIVLDRKALVVEFAKHDIYAGVHYRDNIEYSMYTYARGTCPKAHEISEHIITMPQHMWLTDEDVRKVIDIVKEFCK